MRDTVEIYKSADGEADPTHVAMAFKIYLGFVVELYLGVHWQPFNKFIIPPFTG